MNKARRKEISKQAAALNAGFDAIDRVNTAFALVREAVEADYTPTVEKLTELVDLLEGVVDVTSAVHDEVERLRDEEQEYYDNMPESFQSGDKGQDAETAIQNLDDAVSSLDALQFAVDTLSSDLRAAVGMEQEDLLNLLEDFDTEGLEAAFGSLEAAAE